MIFYEYFSVFHLILVHSLIFSSNEKSFWSFVYVIIYCVDAGTSTLMFISVGLDPHIFRRMMKRRGL